jgi:hypothetical protein
MTEEEALRTIEMYMRSTPTLNDPSGRVLGKTVSSPNKATTIDFARSAVCKECTSLGEAGSRRARLACRPVYKNYKITA